MPRYYFNFRNLDVLQQDLEGDELVGLAAVQEMAMAAAKEIIAEGVLGDEPVSTDYSFEVCDLAGTLLFHFPFSQAGSKLGLHPEA